MRLELYPKYFFKFAKTQIVEFDSTTAPIAKFIFRNIKFFSNIS